MSPRIELGTSRTEGRALTTVSPLLVMQCNVGGEPCATSLFDESRGLVG